MPTTKSIAKKRVAPPTSLHLDVEKNSAPSQWGRRLARRVGAKFGVAMTENQSKNEGRIRGRDIVIKCAKSQTPPVSVLGEMMDRIDELWAVFLVPEGDAEVWRVPVAAVRAHGYQTHGRKVQRRFELRYRKVVEFGKLVGTLDRKEVEACNIP